MLHCYQELMTKCLRIFRENMRQSLVVLLKEVGFFSWVAKKQGEQKYDENDIERFVKTDFVRAVMHWIRIKQKKFVIWYPSSMLPMIESVI